MINTVDSLTIFPRLTLGILGNLNILIVIIVTDVVMMVSSSSYPRALRTHILRLLGPKTILYKALNLF